MNVIDLAAHRRKIEAEAHIPGTLGHRRLQRELDRLIGPVSAYDWRPSA